MTADKANNAPSHKTPGATTARAGLVGSKREGNQGHDDQEEDQRQTKPTARPYR
jgi:hypothetical protein